MLKALLIYESDSGLYVYHKYFCNDLIDNPRALTSLIHVARLISSQGREHSLDGLIYNQFTLKSDNGRLLVNDSLGCHKHIYFHDNKGFSGIISVCDDSLYDYSKRIFESITDYLSKEKVLHESKDNNEVISTIDNFLTFAVEH